MEALKILGFVSLGLVGAIGAFILIITAVFIISFFIENPNSGLIKYIKIAFRNVLANKRRSLFITIAIAFGTMIMIVTMSLSEGLRDNMLKNSFAWFTGHVNIQGWETLRGERLFRIPDVDPINKIIEEELNPKSVLYMTGTIGRMFNSIKGGGFKNSQLLGMDIEKDKLFRESVVLEAGSFESIKEPYVALIDSDLANEFGLQIGDTFSFESLVETEKYGLVNSTKDLKVGAIIQSIVGGMNFFGNIRVSNETVKDFARLEENQTSFIKIFMKNKRDSERVAKLLEEKFDTPEFKKEISEWIIEKRNRDVYEDLEERLDKEEFNKESFIDYLEGILKRENFRELRDYINSDEFDKEECKNKLKEKVKVEDFQEYQVEIKGAKIGDSGENRVEETQSDLESRLERKEDSLRIEITTWQQEVSFLEDMINAIDIISYILVGILMVIILIGISNTLIMSIKERTGEIGTLRAIGMQKSAVQMLFVIEGIILGFFGALMGIIVGGIISLGFQIFGWHFDKPLPISVFLANNTLYFKLTIFIVLSVLIFVIVISYLASLYPSYKATKLKPVTAMQRD
jgi:ABC-type lipoprotein release transport system permease subunit